MPLPESIDGTKYDRKRARELRAGDIVPVERIATGTLLERTLTSVERITKCRRPRIALRYDTGAVDFVDPISFIYYRRRNQQ